MIVECPACHTHYRINDSATLSESTLFECSQERCRQVFPCAPELFSKRYPEEPEDRMVSNFQPEDDVTADDPLEEIPLPPRQKITPATLKTQARPSFSPPTQPATHEIPDRFAEEENFSLEEEEDTSFPPVVAQAHAEPEAMAKEFISRRKRVQPDPESTLSPHILFAFVGILLLGYVLLGVYGRMHIKDTEALLARLPFIGPRFIASQFSANHITLSDLRSTLAVTKDSKQILAIAGKATNTAPVPASVIQIEGTLYDNKGKVLGQQQTFCGTETAVETLPNLTTREIGILQRLAPPKQFSVASGQSISFLIVFANPPTTVAELGGRVLTVQFRTPN